MSGLIHEAELFSRYLALKERVEQIEANLPPLAERAAKQRSRGRRFWETNLDRQEQALRAALERFRAEAAAAKADLHAFEEYNSPEHQAERFRRGEIDFDV